MNDQLRQVGTGGEIYITQGIQALAESTRQAVLQAVRQFDQFTEDNDPYREHDFAALSVAGQRINWKIDYYDKGGMHASDDPANADITRRVMTIMLASEY